MSTSHLDVPDRQRRRREPAAVTDMTPRDLPAWMRDRRLWHACAVESVRTFAVLAAASLVLTGAITALVAGTDLSGWIGHAGTVPSTGGFLHTWSAMFFAAHLAPYLAGGGSAAVSVAGAGPLLLTALLAVVAHDAGRRIGRSAPDGCTAPAQAGRGALLAAGYAPLCLAVLVAGHLGGDPGGFSFQPAALGLVIAPLLAGSVAALGALTARGLTGRWWGVTPAMSAVYGVAAGLVVMLPLAIVAGLVEALGSGGLQRAASLSPAGVAGGIVLLLGYLPNALALAWGAAGGLTVIGHGVEAITVVAPLAGALAGAVTLGTRPGMRERTVFTAAFTVLSVIATVVATPGLSSDDPTLAAGLPASAGVSPWTVLLVTALAAGAATVVAPYLPLRRSPLWPRVARYAWPSGAGAPEMPHRQPLDATTIPPVRISRWVLVAGAVGASGIAGIAVANSVLSDRYGVEAAVRESLAARAAGDPARIVASTQFRSDGGAISLTDPAALRRMATVGQPHVRLDGVQVMSVAYEPDGARAVISYRQDGVPRQDTVELVEAERHLGLYPAWRVVAPAGALAVDLPAHRSIASVSVDGYPVPVEDPASFGVYVVPGTHRIRLAADGPFAEDVETVDVSGETARVTMRSTLGPVGRSAARTALAAYFQGCAAATTLSPAHCPQSDGSWAEAPSNIHWTLRDDPLDGVQVDASPDGGVEADGQWAMDVSYDDVECILCAAPSTVHYSDARHGTYAATLRWTGSGFSVDTVNGMPTTPSPPAAEPDQNVVPT